MKANHHIGTLKGIIILLVTVGLILALAFVIGHPWRTKGKTENQSSSPGAILPTSTALIPAPAQVKQEKYFLKVSAEKSSSVMKVSGETNLSDNSQINISVTRDYTILEDNQNYEGTLGLAKAQVKNNQYTAVFEISDHQWYDPTANYYKLIRGETKLNQGRQYNFGKISDNVKIETVFLPKEQNEEVLAIIGKKGENLNGANLYKDKKDGFRFLKAEISLIMPFALPKKIE